MLEVEVKLPIGPAEEEVRRLTALGAVLEHPRAFEDNLLVDFGDGTLAKRGAMLRVRRYGSRSTLTYKEPAAGPEGYKVREEIEGEVEDPGALVDLLQAAGLRVVWRYMKYRTVLRAGDVMVLLDETPIGNYLELEGPPDQIDEVVRRLGRGPADVLTGSYRELMAARCRDRGMPLRDMVFPPEEIP